jgi:hypothetical protein
MRSRSKRITLITLAACLSPTTLLTVLLTLNTINPMGLAFLKKFTVANQTALDVWVTPIGAIGKEGRRSTLPYSRARHLYVLCTKDRDFHIAPKSGRAFVYDWDDIQFSEILVRTNGGAFRVMLTGLHPTKGQYRSPERDGFSISDLGALDLAAPLHLSALEVDRGATVPHSILSGPRRVPATRAAILRSQTVDVRQCRTRRCTEGRPRDAGW